MPICKDHVLEILSAIMDDDNISKDSERTTCNIFETPGELQAHLSVIMQYKRGELIQNLDGTQALFVEFDGSRLEVLAAHELPEVPEMSPMYVARSESWPMGSIDTGWGRREKTGEIQSRLNRIRELKKMAKDAISAAEMN